LGGGFNGADFSPDGKMVALTQIEREVHDAQTDDIGRVEQWPSVVVADAETFEPLFRVRGASLSYGDFLSDSRWLADSSGVVVKVLAEDASGPFFGDAAGYAVVKADGSGLERLPPAPVEGDDWYRKPAYYAPVPSPTDPDLLAYGRLSIYHRAADSWVHGNLVSETGPQHLSPWAAGGDVLAFSPNHGGHDGGGWTPVIAPRIELPPFRSEIRFRVVGDTCLEMRSEPGGEGDIVDCLEPETVLELLRAPDVTGDRFSTVITDKGAFVLVGAGEPWGWVSTSYLEWA
jgi:hypothetical protein